MFLTRVAAENLWIACTRRRQTTPLYSVALKRATKLPQTSGAPAVHFSCICTLQPPRSPSSDVLSKTPPSSSRACAASWSAHASPPVRVLTMLRPLGPDLPSGDVARRAVSSTGGGAAVADSSRLAPAGDWSALQASSLGRRQAPLSSSTDSRLAPPPLPPFFDNTLNSR